jgi:hypothetical protein
MRKNSIFLFITLVLSVTAILSDTSNARAQGWKPLAATYSPQDLKSLIIPRSEWKPYGDFSDPAVLATIPKNVRQAYIHAAEKLLHTTWPPLPATVFMEFVRNGNRSDYEKLSFDRRRKLATLVLAETFERKGRFTDQIINGIWAICEESFWGVPAHLFLQKAGDGLPDVQDPAVGLFAAETAEEMAWTYYLLKPELDKVNPLISKRIVYETKRRILVPYLKHEDWGYLGFQWAKHKTTERRVNNWNPWINSNVLAAALVLAKDPALRLQIIYKTMKSIDNFVIPYPGDGGSDEGPDYWGRAAGSLLDYLELLDKASGGKIDVFNQPVLRNMGKYIYKMSISYPYYVNYGDADAQYRPDPALLYRFGEDTRDTLLIHFAAFQAGKQHFGHGLLDYPFGVLNRTLPALFVLGKLAATTPEDPLVRDAWLPDIQVMTARSTAGSAAGLYIAAKGGNNGASHNHNDVGNFVVYGDGHPVLIDAGAQTYTAKTFGGQRYTLWNNQSAYHNLPDINGVPQQAGKAYTATDVRYNEDKKKATLSLDIAKAYPKTARVISWKRTITLEREKEVALEEHYQLSGWSAPITENFLTPLIVDISHPGVVTFTDTSLHKKYRLHYEDRIFTPQLDTIAINDGQVITHDGKPAERSGRMYHNWGSTLYRIRLVDKTRSLKGKIILKID